MIFSIPRSGRGRASFAALCTAWALAAAVPAFAQRGVATQAPMSVEQEIVRSFKDPALVERILRDQYPAGMSAEREALLRQFLTRIMTDERVAPFVTRIISPMLQAKMPRDQIRRQVEETVTAAQMRGLSRLPPDRVTQFFQLVMTMTQSIPAADCKKLFLSQLDAQSMRKLERGFQATMPIAELQNLLSIYQQAFEAELRDSPPRRGRKELDPPVQEALEKSMARRFAKLAPGTAARVLAKPEQADAAQLCTVYVEMTRAGLDLPQALRVQYLDLLLSQVDS
jgi:hypothetical protein